MASSATSVKHVNAGLFCKVVSVVGRTRKELWKCHSSTKFRFVRVTSSHSFRIIQNVRPSCRSVLSQYTQHKVKQIQFLEDLSLISCTSRVLRRMLE